MPAQLHAARRQRVASAQWPRTAGRQSVRFTIGEWDDHVHRYRIAAEKCSSVRRKESNLEYAEHIAMHAAKRMAKTLTSAPSGGYARLSLVVFAVRGRYLFTGARGSTLATASLTVTSGWWPGIWRESFRPGGTLSGGYG